MKNPRAGKKDKDGNIEPENIRRPRKDEKGKDIKTKDKKKQKGYVKDEKSIAYDRKVSEKQRNQKEDYKNSKWYHSKHNKALMDKYEMNHALAMLDAKKDSGLNKYGKPFYYQGNISTWYDGLNMKEKILVQMQAGSDENLKWIYKKFGKNNSGRSVPKITKAMGDGKGFGELQKGTKAKIEKMLKRTGYSETPPTPNVRQDHAKSIKIANRKMKKTLNMLSRKAYGKTFDSLSPKRQKEIRSRYSKGGFASRHAKTLSKKLVPMERYVETFRVRTKKGNEVSVLIGGKKIDKEVEKLKNKVLTTPIRKAIKRKKLRTQMNDFTKRIWGGTYKVRKLGRKGQFTTRQAGTMIDKKPGKTHNQEIPLTKMKSKDGSWIYGKGTTIVKDRHGNTLMKKDQAPMLRWLKKMGKIKFRSPSGQFNINSKSIMKYWNDPRYYDFKDLPTTVRNQVIMAEHLRNAYSREGGLEQFSIDLLRKQNKRNELHEAELNRFLKHGGLGYINLHGTTDKAKVGKMVTMAANNELPDVRKIIDRMNKQKKAKPKKVKAKPKKVKAKPKKVKKPKKKPKIHSKQLPKTKPKKKIVKKKKKKKRGEFKFSDKNNKAKQEALFLLKRERKKQLNFIQDMKRAGFSQDEIYDTKFTDKNTGKKHSVIPPMWAPMEKEVERIEAEIRKIQAGGRLGDPSFNYIRGWAEKDWKARESDSMRVMSDNVLVLPEKKIVTPIRTTEKMSWKELMRELSISLKDMMAKDTSEAGDLVYGANSKYRFQHKDPEDQYGKAVGVRGDETITPEEAGFTWNNLVNKRVKKLTLHDVGISDDSLARLKWNQIPEPMRDKIMSIEAFEQLVMRHKKLPSYSEPMQAIASLVNNKFSKEKKKKSKFFNKEEQEAELAYDKMLDDKANDDEEPSEHQHGGEWKGELFHAVERLTKPKKKNKLQDIEEFLDKKF